MLKRLKKDWVGMAFGGWVGVTCGILGFHWYTWQYWVIAIPAIFFFIKLERKL